MSFPSAASIAATGLKVTLHKLSTHTDNLAKAQVAGYKSLTGVYVDNPYATVRSPGSTSGIEGETLPTGLQVGMGASVSTSTRIMTDGIPEQTDGTFDLAIVGDGYFHVAYEGGVALTRDGHFTLDQNRQLVTLEGYPVQPGLTIPENAVDIDISKGGVISVTTADGQSAEVGTITLMKVPNPSGLLGVGGNLFIETAASGVPTEGNPGGDYGDLMQGYVEASNVSTPKEMVGMMEAANNHETLAMAIRKAFEVDKADQQILG